MIENVFCKTGEGGGVDPTCSPNEGVSVGTVTTVEKLEMSISHSSTERGYILDKSGVVLAKLQQSGDATELNLSSEQERLAKDATFTHNHPDGQNLSQGDIWQAERLNMAEMRAVGVRDGKVVTHTASRPSGGWPDAHKMRETLSTASAEAVNRAIEHESLFGRFASKQLGRRFLSDATIEIGLAKLGIPYARTTNERIQNTRLSFRTSVVNTKKRSPNLLRADPTRTATLRRSFETEMVRRFAKFRRKLVSLIVDEDAFGLKEVNKPWSPVINSQFSSTQIDVTDPECLKLIRELQGRLDPADVIELETEPHVTVRYGLHGQDPEAVREIVGNVFCKTGEGGGVDPSCSSKEQMTTALRQLNNLPRVIHPNDSDNKYGTYASPSLPVDMSLGYGGEKIRPKLSKIRPVKTTVLVSDLLLTQTMVSIESVEWMVKKDPSKVKGGDRDIPSVVRVGNRLFVIDGTHRIVATDLLGRKAVDVDLYDVDSPTMNSFGPIWMTIGRLSLFQQPEHDVLKLDVESQGLERLNAELGKLPNTQTHDNYEPHLTIAYLKPGTGWKYLADPSFLEWQSYIFTELTFSDRERQQTEITLNVFCPTGEGGGVDPSCSGWSGMSHDELLGHATRIEQLVRDEQRGEKHIGHGLTAEIARGSIAGFQRDLDQINKELHNRWLKSLTPPTTNSCSCHLVVSHGDHHFYGGIDDCPVHGFPAEQVQNTRWAFRSSPEKVKEFLRWLEGSLQPILTDDATTDDDWWNKYVQAGFKKGAARSYDDMKKAGAIPQGKLPFYLGQKDEFLKSAFRQPESVEKVKLLAGRVYTELKGVTEAMSQNLTRTLTDGLTQGMNPRQIATNIVKVVEDIGIKRARVIARTEIIRAHAEGQLDSMERLGVKRLAVMVEWNTAQDDRVCKLCAPLDSIVVTIDEAKGLIPRHPNCRCAFVPANVGEDQSEQIRGASRIKKAIAKSLVAGKSKRKSTWTGARRKISKSRPKSIV